MKYYDGMGRDVTAEVMVLQSVSQSAASDMDTIASLTVTVESQNKEIAALKATIKELRRLKNAPEVTE